MIAKPETLGVVIAGGRSVRFGGEKAVALWAGRPLLSWAVERLATACGRVAVNARPGTEAERLALREGLEVLHDLPGDASGPLAGVAAGLSWAARQGALRIAVSPCDAPLLPADLFERLVDAAGSGAAMASTADGRQPLCAVWPVSALGAVRKALERGAHPPTWRVLEEVGAVSVPFDRAEAFANVNTREDLQSLASSLHQR